MTRYEYKTIYTGYNEVQKDLNKLGAEGFRFVNWIPWNGNHQLIMERIAPDDETTDAP